MPKFVPRQRKQKARLREQPEQQRQHAAQDSNVTEIVPASKSEIEERRRRLREELRAQQPKISSKKQKRLDKYIDNKLKKEENLELIKKLAQQKVDTSLFHSSKKLGSVTESKRDVLSRALREKRAGIRIEENDRILLEEKLSKRHGENSGSSSDGESVQDGRRLAPKTATPSSFPNVFGVGSGLKRPLETDESGQPIIKRRKLTRVKKPRIPLEEEGEPEWEGFGTETDSDSDIGESDVEVVLKELQARRALNGVEPFRQEKLATTAMAEPILSSDISDSSSDDSHIASSDVEADNLTEDEESSKSSQDEWAKNGSDTERKDRSSAFKIWALQQRDKASDFTPSAQFVDEQNPVYPLKPANFKPRSPEADPLPPELEVKSANENRRSNAVKVNRCSLIQEARLALPVVAEEQRIMEAIHNNDTTVLCGATGSGKTTQVPQFLFEAGYGNPTGPTPGMIGVTQPRRVAAVSMSKRVSDELGDAGDQVAHQIRFDSSVGPKTAIKFMTDGVLLREIASDFALSKYSAIVIDEAHERSANTDILMGLMSRIIDLRTKMAGENPKTKPLKLIIMSATLRISDFTENKSLFRQGPPPVLQVEGRQYPVTVHFARKTKRDYLEETFQKVSRGHKKLPPGGMLVFLTGQNEIAALTKRLTQTFASASRYIADSHVQVSAAEAPLEDEDMDLGNGRINTSNDDESENEVDIRGVDNENEEDQEFEIGESASMAQKVHVLPLYSQLPTSQQLRIFQPAPQGSRMIVLATNVAETSLTIPGIRYVFDCGRVKEKKYNRTTGVQSYEIGWISKASASQRAGRAGRTGPGHCYRLYSSAVYERDFNEYGEPEILRMPIEGIVLQLKSMDLQHVVNFPFPTSPDRQALFKAEKLLTYLAALTSTGKITPVGRDLSRFPLSPRFARMLLLGQAYKLVPFVIALVAALAVPDLFIPHNQLDLVKPPEDDESHIRTQADILASDVRAKTRSAYNAAHAKLSRWDRTSDAIKLLTALCAYGHASDPDAFCSQMFARAKAMQEATQLREQLTVIVRAHRSGSIGPFEPKLPQPSEREIKILEQIVAAGFVDQVAIRADMAPTPADLSARSPRRVVDVPYITLFPSFDGPRSSNTAETEKTVYIHPSSLLAHTATPKQLPQYLVYSHLSRSSPPTISSAATPKTRLHPLTPATAAQLANLAFDTPLLEWGKPQGRIEIPTPTDEQDGKVKRDGLERRVCWSLPSLVGEKGGLGWPLPPARRVLQRREGPRGWVTEKIL